MPEIAAATIAAKNYLSPARVLADSFRRHHPEIPFYLLLADEVEGCFDPASEPFRMIRLADLGIPDFARFRFRYGLQQVAVAAKPWLIARLLDAGFDAALFLDPDLLVLGSLAPLVDEVRRRAAVVTPHTPQPPSGPGALAREFNLLHSGIFNGGVLGFTNRAETRRFLAWWRERLDEHCRHDLANGVYYDQRWLDLLPAFVEDVKFLRDPACNTAYWNLPERGVEGCRLFHFSGFDPAHPGRVTKYRPELAVDDAGAAAPLFRHYAALLEKAAWRTTALWPYAWGRFTNGVPAPDAARRLYDSLGAEAARFGDPLEADPPGSYFQWLKEPAAGGIAPLWRYIWETRPDLRRAFPDLTGKHRAAFLAWVLRHGAGEHSVPAPLLPDA